MKRFLCLLIITLFCLAGCGVTSGSDSHSQDYYANVRYGFVSVFNYEQMYPERTFASMENRYSAEERLGRNSVFGDAKLQSDASELLDNLDLAELSDAVEYAHRLISIINECGYFDCSDAGFKLDSLSYYSDGVFSAHYRDWSDFPDDYEEMTAKERFDLHSQTYGGRVYVAFSSEDGHIISLKDLHNQRICGNDAIADAENTEAPKLNCAPFWLLYLQDVTLSQYFADWGDEFSQLYTNDISNVQDYRFADEELQNSAEMLCADLDLSSVEGVGSYATMLGNLLNTKGYLHSGDFTVSFINGFADHTWEFTFLFQENGENDGTETYRVYISGEDGHVICMFDTNDNLVSK